MPHFLLFILKLSFKIAFNLKKIIVMLEWCAGFGCMQGGIKLLHSGWNRAVFCFCAEHRLRFSFRTSFHSIPIKLNRNKHF